MFIYVTITEYYYTHNKMGKDIFFYCDGKQIRGSSLYMTGNWYSLHTYWNFFEGISIDEYMTCLKETIKDLIDKNISTIPVDKTNLNWYWGIDKEGKRLSDDNIRKSIYLDLMLIHLRVCIDIKESYENCVLCEFEPRPNKTNDQES